VGWCGINVHYSERHPTPPPDTHHIFFSFFSFKICANVKCVTVMNLFILNYISSPVFISNFDFSFSFSCLSTKKLFYFYRFHSLKGKEILFIPLNGDLIGMFITWFGFIFHQKVIRIKLKKYV